MRKLFTLFFALIMSVGTIFAGSGTCGENLTWDFTDGVLTISGTGPMTDFSGWNPAPWSTHSSLIFSIVIDDGITNIGNNAFSGCGSVESVTIGSSVKSIGEYAFNGCHSLRTVTLPNSINTIGVLAFQSCYSLTSINIPENVTKICSLAFNGCRSLLSIYIPQNVTEIGEDAFVGCESLTSIVVDNNTKYDSRNDCNAIIITASNTLIKGCNNTIIPSSVTSIGGSAFGGCREMTSIEIPNSVTLLGKEAFYACTGLTSISIPNSVTNIGEGAFGYCQNLTSITCEAVNPPKLGADVFKKVDKSIPLYVPFECIEAYKAAYQWEDFTNVQAIPGTEPCITASGTCGADGDNLTWELSCGSVLTISGSGAMKNNYNGLLSMEFGDYKSYIEHVVIEEGVTTIGDYAFNGCNNLLSVSLPLTLQEIHSEAFGDCKNMQSIIIPRGVNQINMSAFSRCSGLTEIHVDIENPYYDSRDNCNAIIRTANNSLVLGCVSTIIPNSVIRIGENSFNGASITSIDIPESVQSIGKSAFINCFKLNSITIPASVTSIDKTGILPSTIKSVVVEEGNPIYDSRNNCNAIIETATNTLIEGCQNTIIPSDVTRIELYAFFNLSRLISIVIPNSVTSIGVYAFYNCSNLTSMTIGNSVSDIGEYAFARCTSLTTITCEAVTPPALAENVYQSVNKDIPLYVPAESINLYKTAAGWSEFTNILPIDKPEEDSSPSDEVLATYYTPGEVCVCIYVPTEIACNDIVLTGSFNDWSDSPANCVRFAPVAGYDDWYVASYAPEANPDPSRGLEAKPIMLEADGSFNWEYQVGAATKVRGDVQIIKGSYVGEIDLVDYGTDAPNVYIVDAWKNNPCTAIYHNYHFEVVSNGCDGLAVPYIIGSMTNWNFVQMQLDVDKTATNGVPTYYYNKKAEEGTLFQILSGLKNAETGEIEVAPGWDDDSYMQKFIDGKWVRLPGEQGDNLLTHENPNITFDLRAEDLRWGRCDDMVAEEVLVKMTAPAGAPESIEIIGPFDNWTGQAMTLNGSVWEATVYAKPIAQLRFREAGNWDNQILYYDEEYNEWLTFGDGHKELVFDELWEDVDGKKVITLDFSDPYRYKWQIAQEKVESITVAQALEIGFALAANEVSEKSYEITGYVSHVYTFLNPDVGNETLWITDDPNSTAASNEEGAFEIYRGKPNTGTEVGYGAKVKIVCQIKNYNGTTIENDGSNVPFEVVEASTFVPDTLSVEEAAEIALGLAEGAKAPKYSVVKGFIQNVRTPYDSRNKMATYDIVDFPDKSESIIQAYKSTIQEADGEKVAVNNYVHAIGYLMKKNSIAQIAQGGISAFVEAPEIDTIRVNVAEAVTAGLALPIGGTSNQIYAVTGFVNVIIEEFNEGKESFFMTDVVGDENYDFYAGNISLVQAAGEGQKVELVGRLLNADGEIVSIENGIARLIPDEIVDPCLIASGTCGENLTWELSCDSVLTINGTGAMTDFPFVKAPWYSYGRKIKSIIIAEGVTTIGANAFFQVYPLDYISIPNTVTKIGYEGLAICGLKELVMPNSIIEIGEYAFSNCKLLESVTLSSGLTVISADAFYGCDNLTSVTIPNSITRIEYGAFSFCESLQSIEIPNSVQYIGSDAFSVCVSLRAMEIPSSVSYLASDAFTSCPALISIEVASDNPYYCDVDGVVYSKDKKEVVTYPRGKQGPYTILDGVTSICRRAFSASQELTSIRIPNSVMNIGDYAFQSCINVSSIKCEALTPPTLGNYVFSGIDSTILLYVPFESIALYKAAEQWRDFNVLPIDKIPAACLIASGYCGADGDSLTWELTCDSVLTISGEGAMATYLGILGDPVAPWKEQMDIITTFIAEAGVKSIGRGSLADATNLREVQIANTVKTVGAVTFQNCSKLTSITIPASVKGFGYGAFEGCTGLEAVHISDLNVWCRILFDRVAGYEATNPLYYAHHMYMNGKEVKELIIPDGIRKISAYAFYGGSAFTSLAIPAGVDTIGNYTFHSCSGLTNITCRAFMPPTLGKRVFEGVDKSIPLYVPAKSISLYKAADQWKDFMNILPIPETETRYCELVLEVNDDMMGYVTGSGSYVDSAYVIINATAYETYRFVGWYATDWSGEEYLISTHQNETIMLVGGLTWKAVFEPIPMSSELAMIYVQGQPVEQFVSDNFNYTFRYPAHTLESALPTSSDIMFDKGDEYQTVVVSQSGSTILLNVTSGRGMTKAYVLNFIVEVPNQFMVTALSSNDEWGRVEGSGSYDENSEVSITAIPNEGYQFYNWNNSITENPHSFVLTQDTSFLANFLPNKTEEVVTAIGSNTILFEWERKPFAWGYWLYVYLDVNHTVWLCRVKFVGLWPLVIPVDFEWGPGYGASYIAKVGEESEEVRRMIRAKRITDDNMVSYTLENLAAGTDHFFVIEAFDEEEKVVDAQAGVCTTKPSIPMDVENVETTTRPTKFLHNNHIYILRDDRTYTIQGQLVK